MTTKYTMAQPERLKSLIFLVIAFTVSGCPSVTPSRMVPKAMASSAFKVGSSVKIMDVNGGKKGNFGNAEMVSGQEFKQALILALEKSALFDRVSAAEGDIVLYTTIQSETQGVSRVLQYTGRIVVSYRFVRR